MAADTVVRVVVVVVVADSSHLGRVRECLVVDISVATEHKLCFAIILAT